ncbi:MAG: hypothetical protein KF803_12450 [Cyclobacteriaceae bacterium]|nr:hypothetical protein [Cyclobacteriaceae bacterium]
MFQFGEFYGNESVSWLELLINFLGILVGAGIAILVFRLGKKDEEQKETKRLLELKVIFLLGLLKLNSGITASIKKLEELTTELSKEEIGDLMHRPTRINTSGISWIDKNDLFRIFVLDKKINQDNVRLFYQTIEGIDSLTTFTNDFFQTFDKYVTVFSGYCHTFDNGMNEIGRLRDKMVVDYQNRPPDEPSPFLDELIGITDQWREAKNNKAYHIAHENLLTPIKNLLSDPKTRYDDNILKMGNIVNDTMRAYRNILKTRRVYKVVFDSFITSQTKIHEAFDLFINKHADNKELRDGSK